MITKAQVKDIRALATVRGRAEQGAFIAEGDKLAREWLQADGDIQYIICVDDWLDENRVLVSRHPTAKVVTVSEDELVRISSLQTPNRALIIAPIPTADIPLPHDEWALALDTVQDPGNLGAIIRIADWFGVRHVVCSPGCADYYNPKVVGAAMGGHLRVHLHNTDLPAFLQSCSIPVLAATLSGQSIHEINKPEASVLIIGNESKGISEEVRKCATGEVTIPRKGGAESLNAAVSAGILLAVLSGG